MRKSFFGRGRTLVAEIVDSYANFDDLRGHVYQAANQGADGLCIHPGSLPLEERTVENFRMLLDTAPELPFMFILYRGDKVLGGKDEERQKYLLAAADAGAEVIDVMGDLYCPAPYELTFDKEAVARQKALIEELHGRGAKVVMSSHMKEPRNAEEVLAHLQEEASRGADIVKIVHLVDTEEQFLEAIRTTMLLKREMERPFIHLCSGAYSRLHRFLGAKLGNAVTFSVPWERPGSQPTISQFRAILENIHWPVPPMPSLEKKEQ